MSANLGGEKGRATWSISQTVLNVLRYVQPYENLSESEIVEDALAVYLALKLEKYPQNVRDALSVLLKDGSAVDNVIQAGKKVLEALNELQSGRTDAG